MLKRVSCMVTILVILWLFPAPAYSDDPDNDFLGETTCGSQGGRGCEVEAESQESTPEQSGGGGGGGAPSGGSGAAREAEPACVLGEAPEAFECSASFVNGEDEDEPVDPVTVAYSARDEMVLPALELAGSPDLDTEQLVGVPVWLWLEDSSWESVSAEASVPGGEVTVSASPQSATWDMGDGSTAVVCDGPGTEWDPELFDAEAPSPDCGHTYTRPSSDESGGTFTVSVEVRWEVTYAISGEDGGTLDPLVTSASSQVEVGESFGVVTRS